MRREGQGRKTIGAQGEKDDLATFLLKIFGRRINWPLKASIKPSMLIHLSPSDIL